MRKRSLQRALDAVVWPASLAIVVLLALQAVVDIRFLFPAAGTLRIATASISLFGIALTGLVP